MVCRFGWGGGYVRWHVGGYVCQLSSWGIHGSYLPPRYPRYLRFPWTHAATQVPTRHLARYLQGDARMRHMQVRGMSTEYPHGGGEVPGSMGNGILDIF